MRPGPSRGLLDVAMLAGDSASAAALLARAVPRLRRYVAEDFLLQGVHNGGSTDSALGFHFGCALNVPLVDAALSAGVNFHELITSRSSSSRPIWAAGGRYRLSMLDAAVLGGCRAQAEALAASGVASALEGALADLLLIEDSSGEYAFDAAAVEAALAADMRVEAMALDVFEVDFSYPMRKSTKPFGLLDVAVCLGQEGVAHQLAAKAAGRLAVQGTILTVLAESHLQCREDLFPLAFWRVGRKKSFPKRKGSRIAAAAAAAAELDLAKDREVVEYLLLFAQWDRHWLSRSRGGVVQLCQPPLLRHIFGYLVPKILLTLPRMEECINVLRPRAGRRLEFPARVSPEEAARLVQSWVSG